MAFRPYRGERLSDTQLEIRCSSLSISRTHLEPEPKRHLHRSRRPGRRRLAKRRVRLDTCRIESRGRVHTAELGVIRQIVEFPAKLKFTHLALERETLEHRHIPVINPRTAHDAAADVARITPPRPGEHSGVEHLVEAPLAVREPRIARDIDVLAVAASY